MKKKTTNWSEVYPQVQLLLAKGKGPKEATAQLGVSLGSYYSYRSELKRKAKRDVKVVTYDAAKARPTFGRRISKDPLLTLLVGSPTQLASFYREMTRV